MIKDFDDTTLRSISEIISGVLTHKQISEHFHNCSIDDIAAEGSNKQDRLYFSFKSKQKADNCGDNILNFILKILKPGRYDSVSDFEKDRTNINSKLLFEGIEIDKTGKAREVEKAKTISEAISRSNKIKDKVHGIGIHHDILPYCESEWLNENYFHAILEITKSVAEKLRQKSGYIADGSLLVDECFAVGKESIPKPMLAFNTLSTESEHSEHKGFGNFIKGFFSMYRNPKAHDPKYLDDTQLIEMTEVLVVATIIHNKLDKTFKTGYK